jgi:hypothetical protein
MTDRPKLKLTKLPYIETSVSVGTTKQQIDNILREAGAAGIQWSDLYRPTRTAEVRFVRSEKVYSFRIPIYRQDLEEQKDLIAPIKFREFLDKRERAMFRALFHYIESLMKAEKYGLMTFEEAFVGHVNIHLPSGENLTVMEAVLKRGQELTRALPEGEGVQQ